MKRRVVITGVGMVAPVGLTAKESWANVVEGRSGIGPNLAGLFGRPAGSIAGYNYSAAMKKSGLRWDEKTLDEFLAAPTKKVPGTKMPIAVADPAKRAALIAYLKSATAD